MFIEDTCCMFLMRLDLFWVREVAPNFFRGVYRFGDLPRLGSIHLGSTVLWHKHAESSSPFTFSRFLPLLMPTQPLQGGDIYHIIAFEDWPPCRTQTRGRPGRCCGPSTMKVQPGAEKARPCPTSTIGQPCLFCTGDGLCFRCLPLQHRYFL